MNARDAVDAGTLLACWLAQILGGEIDVPPRLALRIQRAHRAADELVLDLLAQEDAILRRHGALEDERGFVPRTIDGTEEPGTFIIEDEEQLAAANRARAALFAETVELAASPLPLDELLNAGLTLTGRQALQLAALFEDHTHVGG